ncbi:RDD family protein [Microbacterium sp. NPDC055903]
MIWEIHEEEQKIEGLDAAGKPDPAYAAALGLLPAPLGRRALAAVCDGAIWLLLQLPLWLGAVPLLLKLASGSISAYGFLNHPGFVLAVVMAAVSAGLSLVFLIVQLVLHGRKGLTIGKAITGIRTINVRTLEKPGAGAVLLRFLILGAAGIVPIIGQALFFISPMFDLERRGRGWHDQATRVWLVDIRKGLQPYDEKRMRVARKVVMADPAPERAALPSLATPVDPSAQPAYRPGGRISAGVLGVARPHRPDERPGGGLATPATQAAPVSAEEGKPVLGGYRGAQELRTPAAPAHPVVPTPPVVPASPPSVVPAPPVVEAQPAAAPQPAQAPLPQPAPSPAATAEPPQQAPDPVPQPTPAPAAVQPAPPAAQPASPASAGQPPLTRAAARQAAPAARFGLRLDNGDSILISEPVVLGRNPDAAEGARPIALADDSRSLSKTHLLVRPAAGGLEVVDCRSTNGSGLIRDGVEYALAAGTPVLTTDGDTIRIGDRTAAVVRV